MDFHCGDSRVVAESLKTQRSRRTARGLRREELLTAKIAKNCRKGSKETQASLQRGDRRIWSARVRKEDPQVRQSQPGIKRLSRGRGESFEDFARRSIRMTRAWNYRECNEVRGSQSIENLRARASTPRGLATQLSNGQIERIAQKGALVYILLLLAAGLNHID
jgi:hypothetical protein